MFPLEVEIDICNAKGLVITEVSHKLIDYN